MLDPGTVVNNTRNMSQNPNSPEAQKVLSDILRACQLVAGDIYDLIDQICQNDVWSDEQITQIDALIETSKTSNDVKQEIQVLNTLVSIIDDAIVDKKAKLCFRSRQKKILCGAILKKHDLYITEHFLQSKESTNDEQQPEQLEQPEQPEQKNDVSEKKDDEKIEEIST